jgi:thiamine-phosphate pyrophosphorylase
LAPKFALLLITDRQAAVVALPVAVEAALAAVPPGAAAVQLREKDLGGRALAELARALLPLCRARQAPLLVNDRADVALALGLDGVHLARTSVDPADARKLLGPKALIGVSCHSTADVQAALGAADYGVLGPIFDTPSKRGYGAPLGAAALVAALPLGLPVYAVGGITPERIGDVRQAHGIAAIGAALGAANPGAATAALWQVWQRARS